MLQQTQAARVAPAFVRFVARYPSIQELASAPRADVVRAWIGLGYNRRAVALSEAARAIVRDHGGVVPSEPAALIRLPGVGPYTASAVASIAHGAPVAAVDTNVRRVVARVTFGVVLLGAAEGEVRAAADRWLDRRDPGGWNQAMMDLGRDVCRPVPRCSACPLASVCAFRARGGVPSVRSRRQPPFQGSFRQVRGAVVAALRDVRSATLASLSRTTQERLDRVAAAARALVAEGLVRADPAALSGRPAGRVRLA